MDGIPATEYVRSPFSSGVREFMSFVQRAALRDAWGTLCLGDPLSSPLAHYESMWSLVGTSNSLENTDNLK
jgi:hypothetical protein